MLFLLALLLGADWPTIVKPLEKQVVRLEVMQGEDIGSCSASVINAKRGYLLTAAHCIPDGTFSMTANRRDAKLVKLNRLLDIAVLRFTVKEEVEIALATKTPEDGTEVVVAGYGFGIKHVAKQYGRIAIGLNDAGDGVWVDGMTLFGDSGGPVVDALGRQVGINSRIISRGPAHMSEAVRIEDVRDFVGDYLPKVP